MASWRGMESLHILWKLSCQLCLSFRIFSEVVYRRALLIYGLGSLLKNSTKAY